MQVQGTQGASRTVTLSASVADGLRVTGVTLTGLTPANFKITADDCTGRTLGQFGSVPLALAAYNAGPAPVRACGCVPDNGETPGYVARILGLLGGAGDPSGVTGLEVRLVK